MACSICEMVYVVISPLDVSMH
ncbi:MAG: hypothetical protein C0465_20985 [Ralstonia sp.]|nr:hypothetical protein [Ralstonia sp.]OYU20583.1 MAG: hypothetical protein CFE42_23575 [Ralstonia sp. PBBBR1]UCA17516.1 hypothetical protein LA354_23500 [Ralstonia pickettii]MBA4237600.1 hypothetical protein [Ralstonia sp.]MBA4280312.1 hypothetical protein [Ralstonia sp.]